MFDDEHLKEGITLKVYRFPGIKGQQLLSILPRMVGPRCQEGNEVIQPIIRQEKEEAKRKLDEWDKQHKSLWKKPSKEQESERVSLSGKYGNPLFDFPALFGEEVLKDIKQKLLEKGLELKSTERKSNGELDEEILHFV